MRFIRSTFFTTFFHSTASSIYVLIPPAAKLISYFLPKVLRRRLINMVKFFLSSGWNLWEGNPAIAGYSQSRSMPSALNDSHTSLTDLAKAFLFFLVEKISEHVCQPPHPPKERITFSSGFLHFSPPSFCTMY